MSQIDYKAIVTQIAALMKKEPVDPSQDEGFMADDYAAGNIDDAWQHGYNTGYNVGLWDAVSIARDALELKDGE